MARLPSIYKAFVQAIIFGIIVTVQCGPPPQKRSYTLPSVSDTHYQELLADGSYKYAYTGEHRYVAERRLADGTVEGESLYIRPDGVPIKVHYIADGKGYRPQTEVLYKERLVSNARRLPLLERKVVVPAVRNLVHVPPPAALVVPPPHESARVNLVDARSGQSTNLVASNGGNVAAAVPSVTAIVGPGSHAVIQPEAEAHGTNNNVAGFRTVGSGGDVSAAHPQVTAIVGPGSSVHIAPKARATTGNVAPGPVLINKVHPHFVPPPPPHRAIHVAPAPVIAAHPLPPPRVIATHSVAPSNGYVYAPPARKFVIQPQPNVIVPYAPKVYIPPPTPLSAVHANGVLLVPPKPSYRYTYSYSAPDGKFPLRDNSAFVDVQVNH